MSTSHPSSPLPSLPPSRDFMTSLFNSLTFPNASPTQTSNPNPNPDSDSNSASVAHPQRLSRENERDDGKQTQNPFKQLDAQKKALLMTLHVIFPPPLLLHALDLLDRGGVTRVILREEGEIGGRAGTGEGVEQRNSRERKGTEKKSSDAGEQEQESSRDMEGGHIEVGESGINAHKHKLSLLHPSPSHPSPNPPPPKSKQKQKQKPLYQVRSSQPSKWHSSRSACGAGAGTAHAHAAAENTYAVHLDAWNCSCAAFTFAAFPASISTSTSTSTSLASSYFPWDSEVSPDEEHPIPEQREKEQEETWRYGGWTKTSHVPICKHLLACLLVERWGDVLGTCVRERVVGREEMGGLVV